ncbi:hypothetical protein Taro_032243 [Colocasia esculenta]|uniref:Uncharacterized protein n=1 Tax=Colocasia esculenta TaxID=4460 RepID=A0A843W5L1_COLES|nr:hypothetical protein [Colocasia esculenta]
MLHQAQARQDSVVQDVELVVHLVGAVVEPEGEHNIGFHLWDASEGCPIHGPVLHSRVAPFTRNICGSPRTSTTIEYCPGTGSFALLHEVMLRFLPTHRSQPSFMAGSRESVGGTTTGAGHHEVCTIQDPGDRASDPCHRPSRPVHLPPGVGEDQAVVAVEGQDTGGVVDAPVPVGHLDDGLLGDGIGLVASRFAFSLQFCCIGRGWPMIRT